MNDPRRVPDASASGEKSERLHDVRSILLALAAVVGLLVIWELKGVLLLLFGGLIFATALHALGAWVHRLTGMPLRWSVAVSVAILFLVGALAIWFIGGSLAEQISAMRERLPEAVEAVKRWIQGKPLGPRLLELWGTTASDGISWSKVLGAAGMTAEVLGKFTLMLLLGVFIAAEPKLYRSGVLALVPPDYRHLASETLDASREALGRWLKGQGLSMLFVGMATGVGLKLLGVPLALTLGLFAGLIGFVPFFGAIASGLLAILIAFSEGPRTALYVAGLCVLIQQIEGHLLVPLIQRWSVKLAPVLSLLAVVVFGGLFGLLGVFLAAPLMVVMVVLVKKLYVERMRPSKRQRNRRATPMHDGATE